MEACLVIQFGGIPLYSINFLSPKDSKFVIEGQEFSDMSLGAFLFTLFLNSKQSCSSNNDSFHFSFGNSYILFKECELCIIVLLFRFTSFDKVTSLHFVEQITAIAMPILIKRIQNQKEVQSQKLSRFVNWKKIFDKIIELYLKIEVCELELLKNFDYDWICIFACHVNETRITYEKQILKQQTIESSVNFQRMQDFSTLLKSLTPFLSQNTSSKLQFFLYQWSNSKIIIIYSHTLFVCIPIYKNWDSLAMMKLMTVLETPFQMLQQLVNPILFFE